MTIPPIDPPVIPFVEPPLQGDRRCGIFIPEPLRTGTMATVLSIPSPLLLGTNLRSSAISPPFRADTVGPMLHKPGNLHLFA